MFLAEGTGGLKMRRKSIVLCGFMGCGKSTIGSLLAKKMGMSFVDLDTYIEKKEKKTVSEIFRDCGEDYFRIKEKVFVHQNTKNKEYCKKKYIKKNTLMHGEIKRLINIKKKK